MTSTCCRKTVDRYILEVRLLVYTYLSDIESNLPPSLGLLKLTPQNISSPAMSHLQLAVLVKSGWLVEQHQTEVVWRSAGTGCGEPSVMTSGPLLMPPWLADSWVTLEHVRHNIIIITVVFNTSHKCLA